MEDPPTSPPRIPGNGSFHRCDGGPFKWGVCHCPKKIVRHASSSPRPRSCCRYCWRRRSHRPTAAASTGAHGHSRNTCGSGRNEPRQFALAGITAWRYRLLQQMVRERKMKASTEGFLLANAAATMGLIRILEERDILSLQESRRLFDHAGLLLSEMPKEMMSPLARKYAVGFLEGVAQKLSTARRRRMKGK
jgi:hypothetical protein